MNSDLQFQLQSNQLIHGETQKKPKPIFEETKKSFSSSKNQFLSTIFETKIAKQRKLSIQKNIDQATNPNDEKESTNFSISNQYSEFYDPVIDKLFHVKGKKPFYKKIKIHSTQSKLRLENNKPSKEKTQKKFVQIHQPRNQDHEIQFKIYQQDLRKKVTIPGPGAYNISKPLVQPVYQTIQKNENIVLVKLHNVEGTSNFKSGNEKLTAIYDKQKLKNPGPGDYATTVEDLNVIKREKNKSKLEEYAKKYESNYKFIFEVFNSQLNSHESIPNYSLKEPSNDTVYNGKPVKLQQLYLNVRKKNQMKQERSIKFLHEKAKNPSFTKDYEKRSLSQLQIVQSQNTENKKIFQFKTVDDEDIKFRQRKLKIHSQVAQKVFNGNTISELMDYENRNQTLIKIKIQKLIQNIPEQRAQSQFHHYKKKQHLCNGFGYFDGSEKQKLNTKYNVKFEKRDQKLKKLLKPLPNTTRKFQSLEIPDNAHSKTSRYNQKKPEHRYHMNMLDILVSQQQKNKKDKFFLPNSRISFMNELGLEKASHLNSTIQN